MKMRHEIRQTKYNTPLRASCLELEINQKGVREKLFMIIITMKKPSHLRSNRYVMSYTSSELSSLC